MMTVEDALRQEVLLLKRALQRVIDVGHNDDCLLCGFKDQTAVRAGAVLPKSIEDAAKIRRVMEGK